MPDPLDGLLGMPPLDLGETMTMGSPPPPSAPTAKATAKSYAPLLALLPIVAQRGGRVGIAALLQGFQRARAQAQQTERQNQMDAERQRQTSESERLRRATLAQNTANDAAQRRQQVLTNFQSGLEGLDSEEAVRAYLQLYGQQAQSVGLRPEVLKGFAMEAVTPSRLQKKEATRVLEEAKKQYGDQAVSHTYTLKDGTQANWEELNRRAGVGLGPTVPKSDVPNTPEEQQIADVIAIAEEQLGRPLRRDERAQARLKAVQAFRDAGRAPKAEGDPEMAEIRKDLLRAQTEAVTQKTQADQEKATVAKEQVARAKANARKATGDTLDVLKQLIKVNPDGTAALQPGVGNLFGARVPGAAYFPGDTAKASAALKRLKGRMIMDLLAEMKAQSRTGATGFGQLTERELDLIQGAATTLDSTFISNETALEELKRIHDSVTRMHSEASKDDSQSAPPAAPRKNPFRP